MPLRIVLAIPLIVAIVALVTKHIAAKMAVPLLCAGIIAVAAGPVGDLNTVLPVLLALLVSSVGDYFLSNKDDGDLFFVYGIVAYLLAHIGFGVFALLNGSLSVIVFLASLAVFLPYYVVVLRPKIENQTLSLSVVVYLVVSCAVLAAAAGLGAPLEIKALYIAAISLIFFSDFLISLYEFVGAQKLQGLILSSYYGAHLLITVAMVVGLR